MRSESPKNVNHYLGNGCAGGFLIVLGLGCIGVPLQDGVPLGLFRDAYATTSFLLFELVGFLFFAGGVWFLLLGSGFGKPEVDVSDDIRPGETFEFHYKQRLRRRLSVREIDAFFVYREKVNWGGSDSRSRYVFDRLIARQSFPGRNLRSGEEIAVDCVFSLPTGEMAVRNPYMHIKGVEPKCLWMVRVRISFGKSSEIWEDHEIEVGAPQNGAEALESALAELYDVLLLPSSWENTIAISQALKEVAPQLQQSGVPYAQHAVAAVILERIDHAEAEEIAERLRAAGAPVNIVPTESTWRLPAASKKREQPWE